MFDSAVPYYIAFLSSGRLVSIAFEKELLVSRGLKVSEFGSRRRAEFVSIVFTDFMI